MFTVLVVVGTLQAATFAVNSIADTADANIGNGVCDDGTGNCPLRAAIEEANFTAAVDTIDFAIAPFNGSVKTIAPTSPLPDITQPIIINGYTQTGASVNTAVTTDNAVILIEINGTNAGAGVNGLVLVANGSTVKGLTINRFGRNGILLNGGDNNNISGNFIGTDPTGLLDLGKGSNGVQNEFVTGADNNLIGGVTPAARNIISGNGGAGISFGLAAGNIIQGNFIGLGSDGTTPVGNDGGGVDINTFVSGHIIGGDDAADGTTDGIVNARNYISGNGGNGVFIGGAIFNGVTIQGNYIGTNSTGTLARPNQFGIDSNIANAAVIGGSTAGAGNLISGNILQGIRIGNTGGMIVRGNRIGTQADGVSALGNGLDGILFSASSINARIGGSGAGEGNVIAFNGGDGVQMDTGSGNSILSNSIHTNGTTNLHLGIDLGLDGVSANDAGDGDAGANNLQNFPIITAAQPGSTRVIGTLNSTASTMFRLEFFNSPTADSSGNGEGRFFVGAINVTTDGGGNASFDQTFAPNSPLNSFISATATNLTTNDTSEFSNAKQVLNPSAAPVSIGGRVFNQSGRGVSRALISLTDEHGNNRYAMTNPFGYYRFADISAGET